MTDLLERASALATLDDALAAAAHAGRVVLLGGEAGVGKSSLVRALAERHERAARVQVRRIWGDVLEVRHLWYTGELAFWLHVAGELAEVPEPMVEPFRLLLTGDWRAAADLWEQWGFGYHRALTLALAGYDDARLEALRVLDALGARAAALRVRRDLRRRGHRGVPRGPIRATAAAPAGLTARQVDVLRLLADGLTDAEIAARLLLSTKTVGHHVSALLAKLGVASRREAAAAGRRLGIVPAAGAPSSGTSSSGTSSSGTSSGAGSGAVPGAEDGEPALPNQGDPPDPPPVPGS